jgi:alkyl sulfatase BDS1-like metallo-beta-lactamase superfamily hydrolase
VTDVDPSKLVELLEKLDPTSEHLEQIDIDAIGQAIDPTRLRNGEFRVLLEQVDRLAGAGAGVDLSLMGAQTFARLIGRASKDQLTEVLAKPDLRARILDEIFRRMQSHLREEKVRSVSAVVHWRFPSSPGADDYERYQTVIERGVCTTSRDRSESARVTITICPYDFLRLITSNASAPVLFMTGKLKVRGDLAFAASMMGLFDLPRSG